MLGPKIAVVVPVFNVSSYIADCLDSILAQTYKNFDLIAVDDCSTDDSLQILEKYRQKDNRIVIARHKYNQGLAVTRNTALEIIEENGSYEYIAFIDSDDIVSATFLERHILNLTHNRCDISVCGFTRMSNEGEVFTVPIPENIPTAGLSLSQQDFIDMIFSTKPWRKRHVAGGMVCKHVFKASCLKSLRFDVDRNIVEDEFFSVKTALVARNIFLIPDILYFYRVTPHSLSQNSKFKLRLSKGRERCLTLIEEFPEPTGLRIFSSYIDSLIVLIKSSLVDVNSNLSTYKNTVLRAKKLRSINFKTFILFILFCDHKILSRLYLFCRKFLKRGA